MTTAPSNRVPRLIQAGSPSPFVSHVLEATAPKDYPTPVPACATCPASYWLHTTTTLKCFCQALRVVTWGGREQPVMACDARETAIARMLEGS